MMKVCKILLCLLFLFVCVGCTPRQNLQKPVIFYYCLNDIDHIEERAVFGTEKREGASFTGDISALINTYLQGPESDELYSPFPEGSRVTNIEHEGNVLTLYLSREFNNLPLEKLSLAVSCMVRTVYDNSTFLVIVLKPDGAFVDGSTYKTYTADSFLYADEDTVYSSPK